MAIPIYTDMVPSLNAANVRIMNQANYLLRARGTMIASGSWMQMANDLAEAIISTYADLGTRYRLTTDPDGIRQAVRRVYDFNTTRSSSKPTSIPPSCQT